MAQVVDLGMSPSVAIAQQYARYLVAAEQEKERRRRADQDEQYRQAVLGQRRDEFAHTKDQDFWNRDFSTEGRDYTRQDLGDTRAALGQAVTQGSFEGMDPEAVGRAFPSFNPMAERRADRQLDISGANAATAAGHLGLARETFEYGTENDEVERLADAYIGRAGGDPQRALELYNYDATIGRLAGQELSPEVHAAISRKAQERGALGIRLNNQQQARDDLARELGL